MGRLCRGGRSPARRTLVFYSFGVTSYALVARSRFAGVARSAPHGSTCPPSLDSRRTARPCGAGAGLIRSRAARAPGLASTVAVAARSPRTATWQQPCQPRGLALPQRNSSVRIRFDIRRARPGRLRRDDAPRNNPQPVRNRTMVTEAPSRREPKNGEPRRRRGASPHRAPYDEALPRSLTIRTCR